MHHESKAMEQILNQLKNKREAITVTNEAIYYECPLDADQNRSIPFTCVSEVDFDKKSNQVMLVYNESTEKEADEAIITLSSFDRYDLDSLMDSIAVMLLPLGFKVDNRINEETSSIFGPLLAFVGLAIYAYFNWEFWTMFLFIGLAVIWSAYSLIKKRQPPEMHRVLCKEETNSDDE